MAAPGRISSFLQSELVARKLAEVSAVEAAEWLDEAGLLHDSPDRPGKPLRVLLRDGVIEGADQRPPIPNGRWFIVRAAAGGLGRDEPIATTDVPDEIQPTHVDDAAEAARARYRPSDVRVLFIAESRPAGGTFFYFADSMLFAATREAFMRAVPEVEPNDFLQAFCDAGCYLEDLCSEPVNRMSDADREAARERGIPRLGERLTGLDPDLVIIAMKAIAPDVERALAQAGLDGVPTVTVPFPRRAWRQRYVDEVAGHLARWQASRQNA